MNGLTTRDLTQPTPTLTLYRRAVLRGKPKGAKVLPPIAVRLRGQRADIDRLEKYNQACGFLSGRYLPTTYPHILAFPLHMELMTDPAFPFPLLGLVHISNTHTAHRLLGINEEMDVVCRFGGIEPHDKGTAFSLVTEVDVKGKRVWESTSTMLHRHPVSGGTGHKPDAQAADDMAGASRTAWKIPADMGRRYGRASGDMNPIHLHPLTAKAFGFPRHIVHGMWTKARSIAQLTPQIGQRPYTVAVAFKLPVFLPAQVNFLAKLDAAGIRFEVRDREGVKPHLKGAVGFLD